MSTWVLSIHYPPEHTATKAGVVVWGATPTISLALPPWTGLGCGTCDGVGCKEGLRGEPRWPSKARPLCRLEPGLCTVQCTCVARGPEAWAAHVPTAACGLSLHAWLGGGGPVRMSTRTQRRAVW